jgi:hypothetical protein
MAAGIAGLVWITAAILVNILNWFATKDQWFIQLGLVVAAIIVAAVAWFVREEVKSKTYPLAEIVFGAWLASQAAVLPNSDPYHLANIVAFIGGVRIVIDGFVRFKNYHSYRLFSLRRVRYNFRSFKRWARAIGYRGM